MAFITISRLSTKQLLGAQHPLLKSYNNVLAMAASSTVLQPNLQRPNETHDEKNARLNRPLSPHLTIYKFGISSNLSITHRITGCALSVYAVALASAAFCPVDFNTICTSIEAANPGAAILFGTKFMIAFPFAYHTCNGVRHLVWDTARYLNKKAVVSTGMLMLTATAVTTAIVMLL